MVVIFIALLFVSRQLNRPKDESNSLQVEYSDRYQELIQRESLNSAEQAELELETCRFERDKLAFLKVRPFANYDGAKVKYLETCENILPLEAQAD